MHTLVAALTCPTCKAPFVYGESTCSRCGFNQRSGVSRQTALLRPRILLAVLIVLISPAIGVVAYFSATLMQLDVYKHSLSMAFSSPAVQNDLGDRIEAGYPTLGYTLSFDGSRFAEWTVPVSGSKGRGRLYAVANQVNGGWDFSRLIFDAGNDKPRVDLTPVRQLPLPRVPAKNVFLVPIGLSQRESLDWAPAYYKSKLGIDLTVLPPVSIDPKLINPERGQLNADKCVEFILEKYPDLARDPFAILIGVTSGDIFIPGLNWRYAENMHHGGRFAIISSARLHPPAVLEIWNPEWLNSRLQKLLTKNLAMLYFDLPMSSDYTSILSGGVLLGTEIDQMGGGIIGAENRWDSFQDSGAPSVTIYDLPGQKILWRMVDADRTLPDSASQVFSAGLGAGIFAQRKDDFVFNDEPAMQFSRVYRNQDDRSRAFGIGGSDSFDMFLGGKMGVAVDLIMEDGQRVHFAYRPSGDVYQADWGGERRFEGAQAVFSENRWQVKTMDGWTYFFPYHPRALPQYVTVLTSFVDPAGHKYEIERDAFGALVGVKSSSGKWLHFENDSHHRITEITSSLGRSARYDYDDGGHMIRATDSEGKVDSYTYDDKGQMLTAAHGTEKPVLRNEYFVDGYIKSQEMGDGHKFLYSYFREGNLIHENQITDPNGLETDIEYVPGGYIQSLPSAVPR